MGPKTRDGFNTNSPGHLLSGVSGIVKITAPEGAEEYYRSEEQNPVADYS